MDASKAKIWAFAIVIACAILGTLFYSQFSLNHDTSWYLVSTRLFLDGAHLYEDIVEINPPLAFYLTVPPLLISDLVGIRPATAQFLFTSSLAALSSYWTFVLATRAGLEGVQRIALFSAVLIGLFVLPIHDFAQREHQMLVLALPYLVQLVLRDRLSEVSRPEKVLIGLLASLGLALKPYFLLIPAGIILARFVRNRDWTEFFDIPNFSLGFALLAYLCFIVTIHPDYIEQIVPVASLIYSAYGVHPGRVLLQSDFMALFALIALAAVCRKTLDTVSWALFGGIAGALASYLIQFKGWNYQLVPFSFFILLATVWLIANNLRDLRERVGLGIVAMTALLLSFGTQVIKGPYPSRTTNDFAPYVTEEGLPIMVFSTNVSASFPFINDVNAKWASRYPAQWLVPGAVQSLNRADCAIQADLCQQYREVLSQARASMIADFVVHKPELVFVDDRPRKPYFGGSQFEYIPFLLEDDRFSKIWRDYRRVGTADDYQVWATASYARRISE